jgi:DNA-binding NarL/FixJ family response regulator
MMSDEVAPVNEHRDEPARLVVVDDHDFVRAGIKAMLSGEPDLRVVGEATDGQEAMELCIRERPDLTLMDVRMPRMDGLAATKMLKKRFPEMSVLILTMHENQDYLLEAIKAGAAGYVLKDAPQRELVTAIRKVLGGETALNRNLATGLLQRLATEVQRSGSPRRRSEITHLIQPPTPREIEVLELMAKGQTNREIAEDFVISVGTVKNHVEHIIGKLGVSDRTQAVVRALELGIIGFPQS